jgi:hypothetical protein
LLDPSYGLLPQHYQKLKLCLVLAISGILAIVRHRERGRYSL